MKRLGLMILLAAGPAMGQQAATTVEGLLPQLAKYARDYESSIPSLQCDESITSQIVKDGLVKTGVKIESTMREIRTGNVKDPYAERHQFRSVQGKPVEGKKKVSVPYFVVGGFANALGFRRTELTGCYDYRLTQEADGTRLRLEITRKTSPEDPVCRDVAEGYRRTVVVESASGRVILSERTISVKAAKKLKESFYALMEYGPQKIGDETMWLPKRMVAHDAKDEGVMTVVYSNYHRYVGSATLLPWTPLE